MKIFVTGATGFIGSYLVKNLLSEGHELLCLKRETSDLFRLEKVAHEINWVNTSNQWEQSFKDFKPEAVFN